MIRTTTAVLGALLVAAAIALQHLYMGPAVIALSVGLVISYVVWLNTFKRAVASNRRVTMIYGVAVLVQVLHLLEEYVAGFQRELPSMWGYEWSDGRLLSGHGDGHGASRGGSIFDRGRRSAHCVMTRVGHPKSTTALQWLTGYHTVGGLKWR